MLSIEIERKETKNGPFENEFSYVSSVKHKSEVMKKVMTFQHTENKLMTFAPESHDFEVMTHEFVMTFENKHSNKNTSQSFDLV